MQAREQRITDTGSLRQTDVGEVWWGNPIGARREMWGLGTKDVGVLTTTKKLGFPVTWGTNTLERGEKKKK